MKFELIFDKKTERSKPIYKVNRTAKQRKKRVSRWFEAFVFVAQIQLANFMAVTAWIVHM